MHSHILCKTKYFTKSYADHSLYVLQTCYYIVIVIIYVDNLIIFTNNSDIMNELKSSLEHEFEMSGLGKLQFFLGIYFERDRGTIHQRSYIESILEGVGVKDCKHIKTRLDIKTSLTKLLEEEHKEYSHNIKEFLYQEVMGSLMYAIMVIRLDLGFAVSVVG